MFTNQGTVIHFNNPKVQASLAANTFTITGHAETKQLTEMLPGILNQLGADSLTSLRRLAEALPKQGQQTCLHGNIAPEIHVVERQPACLAPFGGAFDHAADWCALFSQLQMEKRQLQQ